MSKLYIQKKSVSELPKATGSISDTLNVEDKVTNAPSINLVTKLSGIPEEGIIAYEGDDIPEGYEETTNPITAIADILFPIGRGFLDFTDTDYSNWLGLTWERELVGMTPIGKDANDADFATVGQTGGEKEHTLTQAELPNYTLYNSSHSHAIYAGWGAEEDGNSIDVYRFQRWALNGRDWRYGSLGTNNATIKVDSGGSGQPHNIMQPYQVVSYWKRVDPNAKTMISFTISGISYQAEEGMTWAEWCDSNYNIDNYFYETSNTKVYKDSTTTYINSVSKADTIMANNNYTVSVYSPDAPT